MKFLILSLILILSIRGYTQHIYHYEILDANEANNLFDALKTSESNTTGWPISGQLTGDKLNRNIYELVEISREVIDDNNTLIKAKIASLNLSNNKLKGVIPVFKLDSLRELGIAYNEITDISAELSHKKLQGLSLQHCMLTKFPINNFPEMTSLDISNNQITGSIPSNLNTLFPKLAVLFCRNNQITGALKINHPLLQSVLIDHNNLSGSLNQINTPSLYNLNIGSNELSGIVDIGMVPKLVSLEIDDNKFSAFSQSFAVNTPLLKYFYCNDNYFQFDDLLPFLKSGFTTFSYGSQHWVDTEVQPLANNKTKLIANVNGATNYQWYYVQPSSKLRKINKDTIGLYLSLYISWNIADTSLYQRLNGQTNNCLEIASSDDPIYFGCAATNNSLPQLFIAAVTTTPQVSNCWENEYFSICLKDAGAKWEAGQKNEIKSTGLMTINDFLSFKGSLALDTANLKLKIDGKFYVQDIPLPGGNVGNFTLAEGIYELLLAGKDGAITGFINDGLKRFVPEIAGLKIKLDSLTLLGGRGAKGVSLSFSIKINNITPCGESSKKTAEIKIRGISITSAGIQVEELESENMGFASGFCLKELKAKYDYTEDELSFALTLLTPFFEIGGGIEVKKGSLETVEFKAELQDLIIPLGTTGIGVIGCEGKVSRITRPPFNLKFGGIISAVANDHLFRLTTSAEFIPPASLKLAAGDGKFFNPPSFGDDWWLAEGGIYGALDFQSYRLKMGGNIKMAPYKNKKDEKAFMAIGSIDMALRKDPVGMVFTGLFKGSTTIPELKDGMPYDWLSTKIGLPYSVSGEALLVYKPSAKFITGDVNLGGRVGQVHYDINLSKRYDEDGFFSFILKEANLSSGPRANSLITLTIPTKTRIAIIKATGKSIIPQVTLTTPSGQVINESSPGTGAELNKSIDAKKTFWTLYNPQEGTWGVSTVNDDSIQVYFIPYDFELNINVKDKGNFVDISWNNQEFKSTDSLDFYIDDDTLGLDGVYMGSCSAGKVNYTLDYKNIHGFCSFYVYAIAYKDGLTKTKYAVSNLSNPMSEIPAPSNAIFKYEPISGILNIKWNPTETPELAGYVISMIDDTGTRVLNLLYGAHNSYQDTIKGLDNPKIYIHAYGNLGQSSCPVLIQKSVALKSFGYTTSLSPIKIYPNPNTGKFKIEVNQGHSISTPFLVYDMLGQVIKKLPVTTVISNGQIMEVDLNDLANGTYLISGSTNIRSFNTKILIVR